MIWNRRRKGRWALSAFSERQASLNPPASRSLGAPAFAGIVSVYTMGAIETDARVRCNHIRFLALQDEIAA